MQSHSQSNSPVTTAPTQQELGRTESGPDAQEETTIKSTSAGPAGPEDEKAGVQRIKTHATTSLLKLAETSNTDVELQERGPEMDSAAKLTVPAGSNRNTKPQGDGKKTDKSPRDGRKYVPSKKAMIDPLKIDMSTQLIPPLSSSQLSLQCMECHIIFSDLKSKERHLKLNHPAEYEQCILRNSLFACYVCDRHFTNSTELMAHQKTHTEKKPFKCPLCSQAFKKSSELTAHKKDHFGQDGYACADCGKPCKTLTLLKYHRRTHTGERPYICKECGKRFTMSKALQKHVLSHLPEGAEGEEGNIAAKAQQKKNDGIPGIKYSCGICKAIFKNSRTRLYHMKTKHALSAADSKTTAVRQQITPIITPISIGQPALLQVEPNGPLQKVDSNIDTEQIRKLIESLGNVQKVKQVVVLGQVPPGAPPLEVQQVSQGVKPMSLNLTPLHTQSESKTIQLNTCNNQCDPMEQTIILEPITPDGQLENPSFSEMGSQIAVGGNIELTLVQTEQTQRLEGEVMPQIIEQPDICALQSQPVDQIVCPNEGVDLEQTVILELTPALLPTLELEQTQTVSENEVPSSALVPTTDLETAPDQNIVGEQETSLSVPPLTPTVELELTPLQTEQQDLPSCPFVPPEVLTQTPSESETTPKEEVIAQQTESLNQIHQVMDESAPQETEQKAEQEPPEQESLEKLEIDQKENQEQLEKLSELEETPKEQASSQSETKQVLEISESPVNVMSAQELVKVRKRKPARAFVFQGYIQEQVRSIRKDDLQIDAKPAKRQRRKPHLVVKFGPQSKDKKNKKQKKLSPHHQSTEEEEEIAINLSEKPAASMKRGRKGKKTRKSEHLVSVAEIQSPSSTTQDQHVQQSKEDSRKTKMKRQKEESREVVAHITTHKTVASPVFKKRKQAKLLRKERPKNVKDAKKKQNLINEEKVSPKTSITPTTSITSPLIAQESLLLLKGHKQPQLKVYKLDPSKASGQTQEVSPHEPQTVSQQKKDDKLTSEAPKDLTEETKKKVGRPKKNQKALSLLSSLQISRSLPETRPVKPKTTRKRKASNVETEGVITSSHSRCALECKDCGESFTELSSLQKHKMTVHTVESPGLTYTNGNVFEGVSSLDLYQLPKQHDKVIGVMRAVADWDTEPEMGEMATEDRERAVSFPALIPSPSLPVPPEVEMSTYEDKVRSENEDADQSHAFPEVHSPSKRQKRTETPSTLTSDSGSSASTQTKSVETREDLATDEAKEENDALKLCSSESEVQAGVDEDLKEDLLLEVDLVTVGEQNERDDAAFPQENVPENESESKTTCTSEGGSTETLVPEETDKTTSQTSQAVSCSTHQMEIKEEEEEILVQRKKGGKGVVTRSGLRGRRRVVGRLKRSMISRMSFSGETVRGTGSEKEQDECQIIYDSEIHNNSSTRTSPTETSPDPESNTATATASGLLAAPSTLEESPDEEVVLELESVTTSVEEVMNERGLQGGEEPDREVDQSPGIILEKILTSRQRETADGELNPMTARSNQTLGFSSIAENELQAPGIQEIKVEETITDPSLTATVCQNRLSASRDIRTVLVKEESSLTLNEVQASQSSGHLRWSVEPVDNQNTASPLMESVEMSSECHVTPELSPAQCIFYPVKEEEREVLLGSSRTSRSSSTLEGSDAAHQTERQTADSTLHEVHRATQVYQETGVRGRLSEPGISDFTDGRAEAEVEWPHPLDLRDFLLRGSDDEEDVAGFELSDPQVESEAEVMAYFYKNQPDSTRQPEQTSQNLPASTNQRQAPSNENRTVAPVDYFYKYFGWDTWIEIANCTNKASSLRDNTTASEVSRFVGIHVAMGTLKFPSPKLYWEDLTKVPLISEAMSLSRFLELSRTLKLTSPEKDPVNCNDQAAGRDVDFQNGCQGKTPTRQRLMSLHSKRQCQREEQSESNGSDTQTDPLWKVQPLLCHFNAACRSLRRDGDYAVDQYLVPLTAKLHNSKLSLHCTTLLGFGGLLLHVDFKLDLSEKEDAVEKMVPKGSMVFLCKQELSTPAMLERLLIAGVHGAGRVGGARGQIGDEFVSSDGKLMLRRSHFGFILSTAGCGQRNMASLSDNFEKAQMSARLNRDLRNLYSTPLAASAPACWPQAVLWYLTDLALVNSWLQYRQDHRAASAPLTLMAFRLEVSKALIFSSGSDTQDSVPPQPPTENAHITSETLNPGLVEESPLPDVETRYDGTGHWPEQLGEGEGGRCRFGDCQRTSRVLCLKCCVFLCISRNHNCFLNFHNQGISGKE